MIPVCPAFGGFRPATWKDGRHADVSSGNDDQRTWLLEQLRAHPFQPGQTPRQWVLWRSKVAEGMSEMDAYNWVQATDGQNVQPSQTHQQQPQGYGYGYEGMTNGK